MAYRHSNGGSSDERESRSGGEEPQLPDSSLHDKPTYLLEHLATFTVNKESGVVYPADGMRRLLQLEKTTGIWSQKMQLCLDYQWVLIMDYETGNIIERFPASLIQEPTAFTSTDAMELYNNILVFIVSSGSGSRSEMHIFQSQSVSAVHLVEDLKNLRSGKLVTQQRESIQQLPMTATGPSMSKNMVSTSHSSGYHTRTEYHNQHHHNHQMQQHQRSSGVDQYGLRSMGAISDLNHSGNGETDSEHGGPNDETSSNSSDKYERDVAVLNHCFDDIEKFIARLQHAAAASRELERRRRNRKTKKKDPGEGLLTLRTRPPHEKEFIDIFAKFKLSFNLLAKLKAHIHDPNAPELVHFLFTPLALIVEAASDTYYESQLPARVINPLLTREAINLLINCVTSKETELWRSLGDAWTKPRDQWKEDVGSYHPVFLDGWSPDYLVIDELESPTTPTNINKRRRMEAQAAIAHSHAHGHDSGSVGAMNGGRGATASGYDDYDGGVANLNEKYTVHHGHPSAGKNERSKRSGGMNDFSTRSDISIDSIERSGGIGTHHGINGANGNSGSDQAGVGLQSITVGMQNLHTRNDARGGEGPSYGGQSDMGAINRGGGSNINTNDDKMVEAWLDELQASGAKIVLVTYPRTANNDKELSVSRGEYLEILDSTRKWWKARNIHGKVAHVPHTIVTPYNYEDGETGNQLYSQQSNNYKSPSARGTPEANPGDKVDHHVTDNAEWIRNKHLDESTYAEVIPIQSPAHRADSTRLATNIQALKQQLLPMQMASKRRPLPRPPPARPLTSPESLNPAAPPPPPLPSNSIYAPSTKTVTTLASSLTRSSSNNPMRIEHVNDTIPSNDDPIQEELKHVLRMRERRNDLDIHKTPTIYIEQRSSAVEVATWLNAKKFSNTVIQYLKGFTGEDLFALTSDKMEQLFGAKEGRRLASQMQLQKSVSGYKTARTSEFQAIMARARPKTEI